MCKKLLKVLFLVILGIFTVIPTQTAFAKTSDDYTNHWAKEQITQAMEAGFVSGYPDGTFRPDNSITRAEFMRIINKSFDFVKKSKVTYPDVKETDWYVDEVAKAVEAKYMAGYEDGTMKPNANITRGEVAVIFTKILELDKNAEAEDIFKDAIPTWSKDSVVAVVDAGYMSGYPDETFRSEKAITRAEAVSTLVKVLYGDEGIEGDIEFNFPDKQYNGFLNISLKTKSPDKQNSYNMIQEDYLYNSNQFGDNQYNFNFDHLYVDSSSEREEIIYYTIVSSNEVYTGTFTIGEFIDGKVIKLVPNKDPKGTIEVTVPTIEDPLAGSEIVVIKKEDGTTTPWATNMRITDKTRIPVGEYTLYFTAQNEGNFYLVVKDAEVREGANTLVVSDDVLTSHPLSFEQFADWRVLDINISAHTPFDEEDLESGFDMGYADGAFPLFKNGDKLHLTEGYEEISLHFNLVDPKNTKKMWNAMMNIPVQSLEAGENIVITPNFQYEIKSVTDDEKTFTLDRDEPILEQLQITAENELKQTLAYLYKNTSNSFEEYTGKVTLKDKAGKVGTFNIINNYDIEENTINDILPNAQGPIEITVSSSVEKNPFTIKDKTIIVELEK